MWNFTRFCERRHIIDNHHRKNSLRIENGSLDTTEETFGNYVEIEENVFLVIRQQYYRLRSCTVGIDDDEENMTKPVLRVSVKQAKTILILLRTFKAQSSNLDDKMYSDLKVVKNTIDKNMCKNKSQSKISSYFFIKL